MLPEFLTSSYKRYKEDTSVFTTWLSQTAKACGYRPSTKPNTAPTATANISKGPRLKGKERKLAKEAAKAKGNGKLPVPSTDDEPASVKYTVTTEEILKQATMIVDSGKCISMPRDVQKVADRAIQARQRCADWFQQAGGENDSATDGHGHFIQVLKKVFHMLKADDGERVADNGNVNSSFSSPTKPTSEAFIAAEMQNRFSALDLEDTDEITPADISTTKAHTKRPQQKDNTYAIWELEVGSLLEITFATFCLFEDLHRIQEKLKGTWRKCKAGKLDIISATVVTTAAFDLVRRAEEDVYTAFPMVTRSYVELVKNLLPVEMATWGERMSDMVNTLGSLAMTPFDRFMYRPTAHTLLKFAQTCKLLQGSYSWPLPILPISTTYPVRPELVGTAGARQREEEDRVLSQLLLDMLLQDDAKARPELKRFPDTFPPFDDEFTSIIRTIWRTGEVSVPAVFASRILLDIIQAYEGGFKGMKTLKEENERLSKLFQFKLENGEMLHIGDGILWLPKDEELLVSIFKLLTPHTTNPPFRRWKELVLGHHEKHPHIIPRFPSDILDDLSEEQLRDLESYLRTVGLSLPSPEEKRDAKNVSMKPIEPSPDLDFVVNCNPLYAGTVLLNLAVLTEEAGVSLINYQLSLFATAHLYNALRQFGLIGDPWPEMERIIEKDAVPLFAGDVPTTPEKICSHFGFRTSGFAFGNGRPFDRKERWKVPSSPAAQTLRELFGKNGNKVEKTLFELDEQIQRRELDLKSSPSKKVRRRRLTPMQFLSALEEYMPVAMSDITVDYIGLSRTCIKLMKIIRGYISIKLNVEFLTPEHPINIADDGNAPMVLEILKDTLRVSKAQELKKENREPFKVGPLLKAAGRAMELFRAKMAEGELLQ